MAYKYQKFISHGWEDQGEEIKVLADLMSGAGLLPCL